MIESVSVSIHVVLTGSNKIGNLFENLTELVSY